MREPAAILLREVAASDLDRFFWHEGDPEARRLAAFVAAEPRDWPAFAAHWAKVLQATRTLNRTVEVDGRVAGYVACFPQGDEREVTYWLGREFWGRGIATQALRELLALVPQRPILARVAVDNGGSRRVLEKCGFVVVGRERAFASGRGGEIEELLLRLDGEDGGAPA